MPEKAAAMPLTLAVDRKDNTAVVHCRGKLVSGVTDLLALQVKRLIPDCQRIVLDLKDLSHMDSMGIGTLVRLYVSAKSAGCALELTNIGKSVRHLLGVTHLLAVLTIIGENNIKWV